MSSASYSGLDGSAPQPFPYQSGLRGMRMVSPPTSMGTTFEGMPMPPGSHRNIEFAQDAAVTGSYQVLTLEEWPDAAKHLHEYTPVFVLVRPGAALSDALRNIILSLAQVNALLRAMYNRLLEDLGYVDRQRVVNPDNVAAYSQYDPRTVPEHKLRKRVQVTRDERGNVGVAAFMCAQYILEMLMPLGTQYTNINSTYPANPNISVIVAGDAHVFDVFQPPANRYNYLWYILKRERDAVTNNYGPMQFYPVSTVTKRIPPSARRYVDMSGHVQYGPAYFYGRVTDREFARADSLTATIAAGHLGSLEEHNTAQLALKPLHIHMYQSRMNSIYVSG